MGLQKFRDSRLSDQNNKTNVLSAQTTTGTGQDQVGITGTSKQEVGTSVPKTSTNTNQAQQQNQQQAQQQIQQQSNVATKMPKQPARSGMFTNIKNILQKNEPAVQQMGQQAGQQFATTAQKVKEQAQQQAKSAQERILQSQQAVQGQEQAGLAAIDAAVNTESPVETETTTTETAPSTTATEVPEQTKEVEPTKEPELADFAATAKRTAEGTSQLDLSEKIKEARALQAQSQGIMTDAAKRNLLRDVFGRGQRQYTSGGQSLDNLLLAMSPQAGKQLTETIQQSGRGLEDISRLQSQGEAQYQNLLNLSGGVEKRLGEASQRSLDQLFGNVESSTSDYIGKRADILKTLTDVIQQNFGDRIKNVQRRASQYALDDLFNKEMNENKEYTRYDLKDTANTFFSGNRLDLLGYDFEKFKNIINKYPNLTEYESTEGDYVDVDPMIDGPSQYVGGKERRQANARVAEFKKELNDFLNNPSLKKQQVEGVEGLELDPTTIGFLSNYFKDKGYYDPETGISGLFTGSDLQEGSYYGYSDKEIARINALKKLRGETDFITPSENYLTIDDLENLISGKKNDEEKNLEEAISSYFNQGVNRDWTYK